MARIFRPAATAQSKTLSSAPLSGARDRRSSVLPRSESARCDELAHPGQADQVTRIDRPAFQREVEKDLALEPSLDLVAGALGHDPAPVQDEDALAGRLHFLQDVGGQDHGLLPAQAPDQLADLDDLVGIEAGGGLVEDEDPGVVQHGLGEARALPEALGQLVDAPVHHAGEAALLDDPLQALAPARAGEATGIGDEVEVLPDGQVGVQGRVLRQVADALLDGKRRLEHVVAVHPRRSPGGEQVAGEDLHDRGLAGPVGAEKADDLPRSDGEGHILHGLHGAVALRQAPHVDHGQLHRRAPVYIFRTLRSSATASSFIVKVCSSAGNFRPARRR